MPAWNQASSVAATVTALRSVTGLDRVLVVDDGSDDATGEAALDAGADVLRLPGNRGKGAAVQAAVNALSPARVYLLIDADLAGTAALAGRLLEPVVRDEADMTVAVLPGAGGRGGFGLVRRLAGAAIERGCGDRPRAPLSGQRAVDGDLMRSLRLAPRFGLETAMTIDARRAGARVLEVEVAMDHRHTGRGPAGFRHRAGQGVDIVRAAWPRLTSPGARVALMIGAVVVTLAACLWSGNRAEPSSLPAASRPEKVVVFGMPHLSLDDLGSGAVPTLDRLAGEGAVAANVVRTLSKRPSTAEGYASLGAGTRVAAGREGGRAVDGDPPDDGVTVLGGPATVRRNDGRAVSSLPGALGDVLERAGKRAAVVGNADGSGGADPAEPYRPAALAVMDSRGGVDAGRVGPGLLLADPSAPSGYRADEAAVLAELERALPRADVVVIDSGDLDRAAPAPAEPAGLPDAPAVAARRVAALGRTDHLLGQVRDALGTDVLLLVVSVVPPEEWRLTPMVTAGAGVRKGYLHSPSTRRGGLVTLGDVAPTILDALGVDKPEGMVGHALRYRPARVDLASLRRLDVDASYRQRIYGPLTLAYVVLQSLLYLFAIVAFRRRGGAGSAGPLLRLLVLAVSAYPLATFAFRAVPDVARLGWSGVLVLVAIVALVVAAASRARAHPLSPMAWILAATVAVVTLDVATGARLQTSSLLGYSVQTAGRFTGIGNTVFAAVAASTVLLGAIHLHHAPRRSEALVTVGCLFALVVVVDGAPLLGSDVGGILTLVPVFGLTLLVMSGRRLSPRAVAAAGAGAAVVLALATGIDLLRPAPSRTHLGRLVGEIRADGWGVLGTTVTRKLTGSLRTYRSPWAWAVPVIAVYMVAVLGRARGWRHLLPPGSALRAGVVGALAAGLLGLVVNDSGVVIIAIVFVYLGPFLTLLALSRDDAPPVLTEAPSATAPAANPAPALPG